MKPLHFVALTAFALSTSVALATVPASYATTDQTTTYLIASSPSAPNTASDTASDRAPRSGETVNPAIDPAISQGRPTDVRINEQTSELQGPNRPFEGRNSICQGFIPEGARPDSFEYREGAYRCRYGTS